MSSNHVMSIMERPALVPIALLVVLLAGVAVLGQEQSTPSTPAAASPLDLKPDAEGKLSQDQMQQLFRVVADKDIENDKRLRDYTYIERDEEHRLDGKGRVKSTEVKTYDVMEIYGEQVQRLIEKDDKPLSEKDAAKEEEKIQKVIDKRKNESEGDRRKRAEKEKKIARRDASLCARSPTPTTSSSWEGNLSASARPG
jgi:hypothetical protein